MKVYLAAPYRAKDQIRTYAAELRAAGVIVTSSWLNEPHKPTTQMAELTHEEHQKYAIQDVKDVVAADILVFFTDPTRSIVRGGRHVEFGIMIGLNIARRRMSPIYVVGNQYENIFHHLPNVIHFTDWEPLRNYLLALGNPAALPTANHAV